MGFSLPGFRLHGAGFALALVAVSGWGCSGALSSPTEYEQQLDGVYCRHSAFCGLIGASEEKSCLADRAAARAKYPTLYQRAAAISDGRVRFDGAGARDCIALLDQFLASDPCSGFYGPDELRLEGACARVFVGLVAEGGDCSSAIECAAGGCQNGDLEGCGGKCQTFAATGESCLKAPCKPDDLCDRTNGNVCRARFRLDDPQALALRGSDGDPCVTSLSCRPGLGCRGPFRENTPGVYRGSCKPYLDVGSACDPAISDPGCPASQWCDTGKKACVRPGVLGATCDYYRRCGLNLFCDYQTSTCREQIPLDGSCANNAYNVCQQGYCTNNANGALTCVLRCPGT